MSAGHRGFAHQPFFGVLFALLLIAATACTALRSTPAPSVSPAPPLTSREPVPTSTALPADGRPLLPIPGIKPDGFAAPPPGKGFSRYQRQNVNWRTCGQGLKCASVLAPLDYTKPNGTALTLVVVRRGATGSRRLGSLFVNPGGPGGSGVEYAASFDVSGLTDYDLVGWDPRGVGRSTPVRCFEGAELDRYYSMDSSPDDNQELQELIVERRGFGQSCLQRSGELLEHISTMDTVRDLDLLRGLLGNPKLNYFGSSYGTRIGALYAQLFTDRVGHLVLDGAVALKPDPAVTQLQGFERALEHFGSWCAEQRCQLGDTQIEVITTIRSLLDRLDSQPLKAGERTLSQQQGIDAVFYPLYGGMQGWSALRDAMEPAVVDADGRALLNLSDAANERDGDGSYGQLNYGFPAIRCLDSQDSSVSRAKKQILAESRKAPLLAELTGADYLCPLWPVKSAPPQPTVTAKGAPPIVVIGTTGDPATPYENAPVMAHQLASGVLVTYRGEGHLAYGKSECVRTLVKTYLVDDIVPANGVTC